MVMPDTPYLKNYKVDYVNMSRDTSETISLATQIASTGAAGSGTSQSTVGNNSTTSVTNLSKNRFWETLIQNIKDILRETDKVFPQGSFESQTAQTGQQRQASTAPHRTTSRSTKSTITTTTPPGDTAAEQSISQVEQRFTFRELASVIASPETGVLGVRATSRQHEKVREFLELVIGSAKRQVLIEATIAEVTLNDQYQGGVDWERMVNLGNGKITIQQQLLGANLVNPPSFILNYKNSNGKIVDAIRLLSTFGTTRVLSSPKIMVLNNQSAILKVVDNRVYFEIKADVVTTQNVGAQTTFTTTAISVPIGFVMNVTPQISDDDSVSLNVRPTISRITGFVNDPNPSLATTNPPIVNAVPEIQTREMESVLKVSSGQIAIMGGLMQDNIQTNRQGVPMLSRLPIVGDLFSYRNDTTTKTELIIFLRPTVIHDASIYGDLKTFQDLLPSERFMRRSESELSRKGAERSKP
jgi:general secretion pathway protein D